MDYNIGIPIQNGLGKFQTEHITGQLNTMIIYLPTDAALTIISELGYEIFNSEMEAGIHYIPIRSQVFDNKGHKMNFQGEQYNLDERIIISIATRMFIKKNIDEIKIKLRIK